MRIALLFCKVLSVRGFIKFEPCLQYFYEDSMDLIAKLPTIAALMYRNIYKNGSSICSIDTDKDWSYNFTQMMGYESPEFTDLIRLYLTIHR